MELNKSQQLAIATAMRKAAKETEDYCRGYVLDEMIEDWEKSGNDRRNVSLTGTSRTGNEVSTKVATISLKMAKGHWAITDMDALLDYAVPAGMAGPVVTVVPGHEQDVIDDLTSLGHGSYIKVFDELFEYWESRLAEGDSVDLETGEIVPGIEWVPDRPSGIIVTGAKPETIDKALRLFGAGSINALLEGSRDE